MIFIGVVAALVAGATWFVGWWGVAAIALVGGFLYSDDPATPWRAALAGAIGWSLLLGIDAAFGAFGRVAAVLGGAMSIPAPALILMSLLLAALLAWSAATIAVEVGRLAGR